MADLFLSDIHGEHTAFSHLLKSACGTIREAIDQEFPTSIEEERAQLAALVYYPAEKIAFARSHEADAQAWLAAMWPKMRTLLAHFGGAAEGQPVNLDAAIEAAARDIQRLAGANLHLVGDVYDRGPAPDLIVDELIAYGRADIQWGNHDIIWMGAALGQMGCLLNATRICARYGNLPIIEERYGIDITPLKEFALSTYRDDPCAAFELRDSSGLTPEEHERNIKIQKALAVIQFKVEAQLIADNPSFGLADRNLLHQIDYERGTMRVDGIEYEMTDNVWPTIDPANPYQLTPEEEAVATYLQQAFLSCERLQRHIAFFLDHGSLYKIVGNNLAFHACVPLNDDGTLKEVTLFGTTYKGRALFDAVDAHVREAFAAKDPAAAKRGADLLWYLWLGEGSPLFAKSKMATFERYVLTDKTARREVKNAFYSLYQDVDVMNAIFEDFGMDPAVSHMVCGHVPVKVKDGEDPCKCGGKVIVIDGGMSKAYQGTTGIAGFALESTEAGLRLGTLTPLESTSLAIEEDVDIIPVWRTID